MAQNLDQYLPGERIEYVNKAERKDKRRTEAEWTVRIPQKVRWPVQTAVYELAYRGGERRLALTNGRPLPKETAVTEP